MFGNGEIEAAKGKYDITQAKKPLSMFERIKLEISNGKYDITQIQKNSLTKKQLKELEKEHAKLINIYSGLDGDKRDLSTFDIALAMDGFIREADEDGDGKLSNDELENYAKQLNEKAGLSGENEIKANELKSFIKRYKSLTEGAETVSTDAVIKMDNLIKSSANEHNLTPIEGERHTYIDKDGIYYVFQYDVKTKASSLTESKKVGGKYVPLTQEEIAAAKAKSKPAQNVEAPVQNVEASVQNVEAPAQKAEPPVQEVVENPVKNEDKPVENSDLQNGENAVNTDKDEKKPLNKDEKTSKTEQKPVKTPKIESKLVEAKPEVKSEDKPEVKKEPNKTPAQQDGENKPVVTQKRTVKKKTPAISSSQSKKPTPAQSTVNKPSETPTPAQSTVNKPSETPTPKPSMSNKPAEKPTPPPTAETKPAVKPTSGGNEGNKAAVEANMIRVPGSPEAFNSGTLKLLYRSIPHSTKLLDVAQSNLGIVEVTPKEYANLSAEDRKKTQVRFIGNPQNVGHQWCAYAVSYLAQQSGMNIGGKKAQVQLFINWAKQTKTYNSIKTNTFTSSNIEEERSNRLRQIKAQLPKMHEGDFIIWKTDYAINSNPPHFLKSSHIGIIESVDVKAGTVTVIEGNANEYVIENGERVLVQNSKQKVNGDQQIGEPQEVNRRDGLIRKVYTIEELAKYGYSGFIDNSQRVPRK